MTLSRDISLFAGRSKVLRITVGGAQGAVDLTGVQSIRYRIAAAVGVTPIVDKSLGNGITVVDPLTGRIDITLDAADTLGQDGEYLQELEIIESNGAVHTALIGRVTLLPTLI